jgi:hypothetical protein
MQAARIEKTGSRHQLNYIFHLKLHLGAFPAAALPGGVFLYFPYQVGGVDHAPAFPQTSG